jgi:SNF family Na+-dependent transporter
MLFLAAITSSLSMLQPVMAFFEEGLGLKRRGSTLLMFVITLMGTGFVMYYSKNLNALDAIDFWAGELFIVVLALVQAVIYGWVFGIKLGQEELDSGAELKIPRFVQFVIKFVSPTFLIWILYATLTATISEGPAKGSLKIVERLRDPIQLAGFSIVMGSLLFLWVMVFFAGQRWKREGRA